jgi:hypothetical protein
MKTRMLVLLSALVALSPSLLRADDVARVIAQARSYLGSEAALSAVKSIHFAGVIQVDATTRVPVEIVFQKDYQQRITVTGPKVIETTALDGYDAWQKRTNPLNLAQWQVTLLDAVQVKRLRANTWENLNFFAGLERKGGTVQLQSEVNVDGVACVTLAFIHGPDIVFQADQDGHGDRGGNSRGGRNEDQRRPLSPTGHQQGGQRAGHDHQLRQGQLERADTGQ